MNSESAGDLLERMVASPGLFLFLDYDGTLADFAPTPDHILPDPQVIGLVTRLADYRNIQVVILSGRRLRHIQELLPVEGILLAGTYGLEMLFPQSGEFQHFDLSTVRPTLETIKSRWSTLLEGRQGFYLEDKGWTLAIHARFAEDGEASSVLAQANELLEDLGLNEEFRVIGGSKFLEIGPALANKGKTVNYLLERFHRPGELIVYIGDDDKDEEAFAELKALGGVPVVVSAELRPTLADYRIASPQAVRAWLKDLLQRLEGVGN